LEEKLNYQLCSTMQKGDGEYLDRDLNPGPRALHQYNHWVRGWLGQPSNGCDISIRTRLGFEPKTKGLTSAQFSQKVNAKCVIRTWSGFEPKTKGLTSVQLAALTTKSSECSNYISKTSTSEQQYLIGTWTWDRTTNLAQSLALTTEPSQHQNTGSVSEAGGRPYIGTIVSQVMAHFFGNAKRLK